MAPIKEEIINIISKAEVNTVFYYDFKDVQAINSSGVDEVISKIIRYLCEHEKDKYLYFINLNNKDHEHTYNIETTLSGTKLAIVERLSDGKANFIGDISGTHIKILESIYQFKKTTAREIADLLNKQPNLISTHLNTLYKQRLIKRVEEPLLEGGRQYIYESIF
ncbi:winged helix-turn-helix domain-containing protein [Lysinibacillus sp. fls2-241-R2A-57]|uniref:winged helix-turn-helix domain-containing protein n=1 Tax=Lysinibacillus sp. fls2-241-R2A-57 TaxID=3040292 RepID=UPI0025550033|nr:winged helix-turn-helix domain-containing protein [Lysinibacillus sp. fls2-241-R2A-57]